MPDHLQSEREWHMVAETDSAVATEPRAETGPYAGAPVAVTTTPQNTPPLTWKYDSTTQTYTHPVTQQTVTIADLRAWEKTQKGEGGKDLLRGVKLRER